VGASYLERNWPEAFRESGAWPMGSLRKCFLDGSLTRLVDSDKVLRERIPDLVSRGEVGFATGQRPEGGFNRLWFEENGVAGTIRQFFTLRDLRKHKFFVFERYIRVAGTCWNVCK
jgi:hypothetical protein